MLKTFWYLLMTFIAFYGKTQTISFSKKVYHTGEHVIATVTGELKGVENEIKKSSYATSGGVLDLGVAESPGFFRLDFKFGDGSTRSFLLAVISSDEQTAEEYNIELKEGKLTAVPSGIAQKMLLYFKRETHQQGMLSIAKKGLEKFARENAVGLVSNVSFCVSTISGVPVVITICESLSVSNAKKLGIELLKAFISDMKTKNYLTEEEKTTLIRIIDASQVGALLKSNCSLIFKSLKQLSSDENLKLAMGYFEQQCKTAVLIIEKFKPLP